MKWKVEFPDMKRGHATLFDPVWNCVHKNPDTVPASQHKQFFQTVCFGPFISPGVHKDNVFDIASKFFQGKRFAFKPWGQGDKLQAPSSLLQQFSKECFLPAFCSGSESLVAIQVI